MLLVVWLFFFFFLRSVRREREQGLTLNQGSPVESKVQQQVVF